MPGPYLYPPPETVKGIPTRQELDDLPKLYTWEELKDIVGSGELGDLKRHPILAERYMYWAQDIQKDYGSTERYLVDIRLPWSIPPIYTPTPTGPSTPLLPPTPTSSNLSKPSSSTSLSIPPAPAMYLPPVPAVIPTEDIGAEYLTFSEGEELDLDVYAVLPNDWPYNVPLGVDHCLVWSKLPIFHPALVQNDPIEWAKISQEGFAGFTGTDGKGRGDWCAKGGEEVDKMVRALWGVGEFECAWFVNPPRLQSVRGLSHFHVFARSKATSSA